MKKWVYYNEIDPFAAGWIRELMKAGHIAQGEVDERDIQDVQPDDVADFIQCHWFAGVAVWSLALRSAGWPDDRAIWTASCPCQPFSAAGKGGGFADERHLWPALHWLIGQCRPLHVIGEQVASKDGLAWLDLVFADLEASEYAVGAVDTCAAGFGAPHIRQRSFWAARRLADTYEGQRGRFADGEGCDADRPPTGWQQGDSFAQSGGDFGRVADADDARSQGRGEPERERAAQRIAGAGGVAFGMADATDKRHERTGIARGWRDGPADLRNAVRLDDAPGSRRIGPLQDAEAEARHQAWVRLFGAGHGQDRPDRPGPTNGLWRAADWLGCTDGKWRPVEPSTFPLAHAGAYRNRVAELRGAGNAINVAQAQGFIEAFAESLAA